MVDTLTRDDTLHRMEQASIAPVANADADVRRARLRRLAVSCVCGNVPCDGLDCGPYLPGCAPRRKPEPKPAEEVSSIRIRAWATRREKYGQRGHA